MFVKVIKIKISVVIKTDLLSVKSRNVLEWKLQLKIVKHLKKLWIANIISIQSLSVKELVTQQEIANNLNRKKLDKFL